MILYHHTKNYQNRSSGSWDIQIWKIEQSDWPRAFRTIFGELEFSQTCGFCRIVKNIILNDFREKKVHINGQNFRKNPKNPIFGPILALSPKFWENQSFPEKSGSVTFLHLWSPNFMQKMRKNLRANSEISASQIDRQTDGRTEVNP